MKKGIFRMLKSVIGVTLLAISFASYAAENNTKIQLEDVVTARQLGETKIETNDCFAKISSAIEIKKQIFSSNKCLVLAEQLKKMYVDNKSSGKADTLEIIMNDVVFFSGKK